MVEVEVEVEEEVVEEDGTVTIQTRWVKKKTKRIQSKTTPPSPSPLPPSPTAAALPVVVDADTKAFAAMALQCLLKGSALNANMLKRTMGTWAVPTLQGRFVRWKNNVDNQKQTRKCLKLMFLHINNLHCKRAMQQWNDSLIEIREYVRKRNLLWRTISYKTRTAMGRAFQKMRGKSEEKEGVSFSILWRRFLVILESY